MVYGNYYGTSTTATSSYTFTWPPTFYDRASNNDLYANWLIPNGSEFETVVDTGVPADDGNPFEIDEKDLDNFVEGFATGMEVDGDRVDPQHTAEGASTKTE